MDNGQHTPITAKVSLFQTHLEQIEMPLIALVTPVENWV